MPPTAEVTAKVSPARSYPRLFLVTGPLMSLVFRTEDVWQRCNQFIETAEFSIRVSPSHSYNAGRVGLRWMGGWTRGNVYDACSDCVVVLVLGDLVAWRHSVFPELPEASQSFWKLPRSFLEALGSFRKVPRSFRKLLGTFLEASGSFPELWKASQRLLLEASQKIPEAS